LKRATASVSSAAKNQELLLLWATAESLIPAARISGNNTKEGKSLLQGQSATNGLQSFADGKA
jgi:hypothetical protein